MTACEKILMKLHSPLAKITVFENSGDINDIRCINCQSEEEKAKQAKLWIDTTINKKGFSNFIAVEGTHARLHFEKQEAEDLHLQ